MRTVKYSSGMIGSCDGAIEVEDDLDENAIYELIQADIEKALNDNPTGFLDIDIYLDEEL